MIAYVDTSVVLRRLFLESNRLAEWPQIRTAYTSRLVHVEAHRSIDRIRVTSHLDDSATVQLLTDLRKLVTTIEVVEITESILVGASAAMPTAISTLDAIHLATALEVARHVDGPLVVATHDVQLGRAARALGFAVVGVA